MEPSINLLAVLNLLGAAQGIFLSALLLSIKGGKRIANRILAALVAAIAITVAGGVVRTMHYDFVYPHLSRIHDPFPFLAIPLLYLYIKTLTSKGSSFSKKEYIHFIPFILCVLYLIPYYFKSRADKLQFLIAEYYYPSPGWWYYIRSGVLILLAAFYLIFIIRAIVTFTREVGEQPSSAEKSILFQIRFFVWGFVLLFAGGVLRYLLDHTARTNLLVPLGASLFIYAIGYLSFRHPQTLSEVVEPPPVKKYGRSRLSPETAQRYLKRLLQSMETEKLYLDSSLTISKLSERLSIPTPHLSQIINERLGQSFVDFINTYRVEEAKKRLLDPARKHISVLAIAEQVGFNSKSSFNSVFKKHVQMTPSEFRKSVNGDTQD
jgi:AraC-like DNA-binding protein